MEKAAFLLLLVAAASSAPLRAQDRSGTSAPTLGEALRQAAPAAPHACESSNPAEVVVCGRSRRAYRIDPNVLAATRAVEAPPAKPALDASVDNSCTGPNCGGATIPLVGMALTALKAAELAADGDDWREAFRTHPDAYQAYQDAQRKQGGGAHVSVGVSAGSR